MKMFFLPVLLIYCFQQIHAQSTQGLTGKRDTAFTSSSAYLKTLKQYPDISLVKEQTSKSVKEIRNQVYCRIASRELKIDAFQPVQKRKSKTPAVLIVHGGGWRSGDRQQHIPLAQRLAAAGYASYTVEYRLSTEALYPAAIHDLKAALRWIRANARRFNVDTAKIAVLGFSAGGELAAFMGVTAKMPRFEGKNCNTSFSSSVQAVIDIDGTLSFVHPESGEGNDSKSISAATYWFGYPKKENPELWQDASPLTHAENNKAPFLFINSSIDRMHAGRDDFRKILEKNNIYSEVHTFENSPHSFCLFEPWFEPTLNYCTAFLSKVFSDK